MEKLSVLLIDDEVNQLLSLKTFLEKRNYEVYTASNGREGFSIVERNKIDIAITDLRMPEWDGFRFLNETKSINPETEILVVTAFGTIEDAVKIMKAGAFDYLTKPLDLDELEMTLRKIAERKILIKENRELRRQLGNKYNFQTIITRSENMEQVLNQAYRVADSHATVLVRGESGTGKELFAHAVHFAGTKKDKPFVVVNVAALSENLLESELFGHEKGSFTGALEKRTGRFEEADGGTLFIDEIGDIPMHLQVKLLRAIQSGEIQRIGSNQTIKTNVRIVAATNRNLEEMIKNNEFREDLYYRINVIEIKLPPLRARKQDIPVLAEHFIKKFAAENNKQIDGMSRDALDYLIKYHFPGNVRELQNIIERAVVFTRGTIIEKDDLPGNLAQEKNGKDMLPNDGASYEETMTSFEIALLQDALKKTNGNQSAAARLLNMSERHLRSRMKILNLK